MHGAVRCARATPGGPGRGRHMGPWAAYAQGGRGRIKADEALPAQVPRGVGLASGCLGSPNNTTYAVARPHEPVSGLATARTSPSRHLRERPGLGLGVPTATGLQSATPPRLPCPAMAGSCGAPRAHRLPQQEAIYIDCPPLSSLPAAVRPPPCRGGRGPQRPDTRPAAHRRRHTGPPGCPDLPSPHGVHHRPNRAHPAAGPHRRWGPEARPAL